jgi:hypothetical protein
VESGVFLENRWDYILLAELLEHIDNPIDFLMKIRKKFRSNVEDIIISVPNGLSLLSFGHLLQGVEIINSDHRYLFTPYTLSKVVVKAGLEVKKIVMCKHGRMRGIGSMLNPYFRMHPLARNTIVMIAGFGQ